MKKVLVLIVFLFTNFLHAQFFDWAKGISSDNTDYHYIMGKAISTDANGNSYITGSFNGTATFGTQTLTSNGGNLDIFIAKYDNTGNCLWTQKAGGIAEDRGYGVSIDATGNSYITGSFIGTATFGTFTLTSYGSNDIFIAKYDAKGNCLWVKQAGGTEYDQANGITTDAFGTTYLTGDYNGIASFGTSTLTGYGNLFIAKYDNAGNCLWAKQAGGIAGAGGSSVSADAFGNCFITGNFSGTAIFGTTTIISSGYTDIFIAKYDNTGSCLWAKQAGGTSYDQGTSISTDDAGNSYLTGGFHGTAAFDVSTITSSGGQDIFIAKYDNTGNCLWAQKAGGTSTDQVNRISKDAIGNSYITGFFYGAATFGTSTITTDAVNQDIFIAKYDNTGNCLWVKQVGGLSYDEGNGVSSSENGYVYVTGTCRWDASFGGINLNLNGSAGSFITKIANSNLNITAPIGSESWQTNSQHNITWNSIDNGNIKIEITTNNGSNWITLQSSVVANLGNYTLTVPPFSTSSQCMIRLTSLSYGNVSTSSAFTITSASVPNLTITSPNTAVKWNGGSAHNITWTLTGNVDNVKLEYTTDNGAGWHRIINSTPAAAQSYEWVVSNEHSTSCRIRVSDITTSTLNDVSDALFTLANISITSPDSGEKWKAGIVKNIIWTSAGAGNVNLFYSTNNGTDWTTITSNLSASSGSYSWTVPNVTSAECKIKIVDAADGTLFNIGKVFTIWQPVVSTQTPATGQVAQSFGLTNIDFSAFILVADAITTTFYPYEAPQTGTLPDGVFVVSKYYWSITSSASLSFFNGVISVPLASLTWVNDSTKLVWLKRTNPGDAWTNIGGSISGNNLVSTVAFNSFSEFAIGATDQLPVELTSFSAMVSKNSIVTLEWKTSTEKNNQGFEIEKSISDKKSEITNWTKIGFVAGNGTSTEQHSYSYLDNTATRGKYVYRLKQIDYDGKYEYSKEVEVDLGMPTKFSLEQNYPNPFNPTTTITYALPFESNVKLVVYNVIGEVVKELVNGTISTGYQEVSFDAGKLSSGIYFYTLHATSLDGKQNYQNVKKMLLIK